MLPNRCRHWSPRPTVQPPISRVCRQMRQEALPIFYDLNVFVVNFDSCGFKGFMHHVDTTQTSGIKNSGHIIGHIIFETDGNLRRLTWGPWPQDLACWHATHEVTWKGVQRSGTVARWR